MKPSLSIQNTAAIHLRAVSLGLAAGNGLAISSHPSHVVADFVSFAATFFKIHRLAHAVAPPLRKKARSAHLLGCKRPYDGSLSLPPFYGLPYSTFRLKHKIGMRPPVAGVSRFVRIG